MSEEFPIADKLKALLRSRRFWAGITAVALAIGNDVLELGMDEQTVELVILSIAGWVIGDSLHKTR